MPAEGAWVKCCLSILSNPKLTGTDVKVYLALTHFNNLDNQSPSFDRLAATCAVGRSSVKRSIMNLKEQGLIAVKHGGKGGTNRYTIRPILKVQNGPRSKMDRVQNGPEIRSKTDLKLGPKRTHKIRRRNKNAQAALALDDTENVKVQNGPKETTSRKPDRIWDTLAEIFFESGVPPSARTRLGKLVRDIKAMQGTPEQIKVRTARLRANWSGLSVTPEALVKHWDSDAAKTNGKHKHQNTLRVIPKDGKYDGIA